VIKKIVIVEVYCDSENIWDNTLEDINELISMLRNNSRDATIIKITESEDYEKY
tara:strand:- start:441 stop:602 length:162 start_codon:yes stop_codon:yes gene_type:complete